MSEDTQTTDQEPVVNSEPSLDDVIAEYNVQPAERLATQPTPQAYKPSEAPRIDPLDETQFNSYVQQVNQGQSVLNTQLEEVRTELTELRQERAARQIDADIKQAVGKINEGLDLDPRIIRTHLEIAAQEKPGFRAIWENRESNPQAYEKALSAISREVGNLYSVKQDPELTANQQAVRQSAKSLAGKSGTESDKSPIEEALANASSEAERDAIWMRYTSTGY